MSLHTRRILLLTLFYLAWSETAPLLPDTDVPDGKLHRTLNSEPMTTKIREILRCTYNLIVIVIDFDSNVKFYGYSAPKLLPAVLTDVYIAISLLLAHVFQLAILQNSQKR